MRWPFWDFSGHANKLDWSILWNQPKFLQEGIISTYIKWNLCFCVQDTVIPPLTIRGQSGLSSAGLWLKSRQIKYQHLLTKDIKPSFYVILKWQSSSSGTIKQNKSTNHTLCCTSQQHTLDGGCTRYLWLLLPDLLFQELLLFGGLLDASSDVRQGRGPSSHPLQAPVSLCNNNSHEAALYWNRDGNQTGISPVRRCGCFTPQREQSSPHHSSSDSSSEASSGHPPQSSSATHWSSTHQRSDGSAQAGLDAALPQTLLQALTKVHHKTLGRNLIKDEKKQSTRKSQICGSTVTETAFWSLLFLQRQCSHWGPQALSVAPEWTI